jgi:hypothetical protein
MTEYKTIFNEVYDDVLKFISERNFIEASNHIVIVNEKILSKTLSDYINKTSVIKYRS